MKQPTNADLIRYLKEVDKNLKALQESQAIEQEESRRWRQSFQRLFNPVEPANRGDRTLESYHHRSKIDGSVRTP